MQLFSHLGSYRRRTDGPAVMIESDNTAVANTAMMNGRGSKDHKQKEFPLVEVARSTPRRDNHSIRCLILDDGNHLKAVFDRNIWKGRENSRVCYNEGEEMIVQPMLINR